METWEREVRAAEEELRLAMLTNDVAALGRLLDDELVFSGPDGAVVGKAEDLAAHAARRLRLTRLDLDDVQLSAGDDSTVVVSVRARLVGQFDGQSCDGDYRYTRTWRKRGGAWQIVAGGVRLTNADPSAG